MVRRIDYYFSMVSPWAYIGHPVFVAIARRRAAQIVYRPVPLSEVFFETGGLPLAKRHPARQAYRMMELQRWREKRGLAFHLSPKFWPFDADLANRVVIAAAAEADPARLVQEAFNGVWENEQNLADAAVLAALLRRAGFDPDATLRRADWRRAAPPTSAIASRRSRPAPSVRRATCSTARCSGARTASSCSTTRWRAAARLSPPARDGAGRRTR